MPTDKRPGDEQQPQESVAPGPGPESQEQPGQPETAPTAEVVAAPAPETDLGKLTDEELERQLGAHLAYELRRTREEVEILIAERKRRWEASLSEEERAELEKRKHAAAGRRERERSDSKVPQGQSTLGETGEWVRQRAPRPKRRPKPKSSRRSRALGRKKMVPYSAPREDGTSEEHGVGDFPNGERRAVDGRRGSPGNIASFATSGDEGESEGPAPPLNPEKILEALVNMPGGSGLTQREQDVLKEISRCEGDPHNVGKAAARMGLSPVHVRRLRRDALTRLGLPGGRQFNKFLRAELSRPARSKMADLTDSELRELSNTRGSHWERLQEQRKLLQADVESSNQKMRDYESSHPRMTRAERRQHSRLEREHHARAERLKRHDEKAQGVWERYEEIHGEWQQRQVTKAIQSLRERPHSAEESGEPPASQEDHLMGVLTLLRAWGWITYPEAGAKLGMTAEAVRKKHERWLAGRKIRLPKVSE